MIDFHRSDARSLNLADSYKLLHHNGIDTGDKSSGGVISLWSKVLRLDAPSYRFGHSHEYWLLFFQPFHWIRRPLIMYLCHFCSVHTRFDYNLARPENTQKIVDELQTCACQHVAVCVGVG